ncbi:X-ray radiation resistance-associated protein 1-like [Elgaria multicarinata webbii]|uniref:X-ray radiation resistance-associated protein 1-like n=1 Tax=Elgaria multicarinata webbii TaxID=159646 RepID=UPI002FCD053D
MPTAQCSLDALLFGSVPSTRSSLDEILSRSFPPRRSVSEEQARTVPSVLVPPSQSTSGELYKLFAKAHSDAVPFGLSGERSSEDEMSHSSGEFVEDEESESFFMTQGDEASGSHLKPLTEEPQLKQPREDKKREYQNVPEKYKGYEELLGGDPGPDFIEPLGIQQNVKALEKALRYQRVYRESKAKLDTFQKPFVPAEKKALRVPAPPAQKTKVERLEEILLKMRNPTNIVQVPLVCILRRKKENWREYREALALLKEFRKNYKATVASCNLAGESKSMSKNGVDADVINQNQLLRTIPKVKVNKEQLEEEFPFRVTQEDEGLSSILPEKNFPPTQQC